MATSNEVLQPYDVKGALEGKCLYRGKAPHLAVVIKSIEQLSSTDTSVVVCDRSGRLKKGIQSSPAWLSTVFYSFEETINK